MIFTNIFIEQLNGDVSLRDKKVEELRKTALADAKRMIAEKDSELKQLQDKIKDQQRRFDSVNSRQSKVKILYALWCLLTIKFM